MRNITNLVCIMKRIFLYSIIALTFLSQYSFAQENYAKFSMPTDTNEFFNNIIESTRKHIERKGEIECAISSLTNSFCNETIKRDLLLFEEKINLSHPVFAQRLIPKNDTTVYIDTCSFIILLVNNNLTITDYIICYKDFFVYEKLGCMGCSRRTIHKLSNIKKTAKKQPDSYVFSEQIWGFDASPIGYIKENNIYINDFKKDYKLTDYLRNHKVQEDIEFKQSLLEYEKKCNLLIPYIQSPD